MFTRFATITLALTLVTAPLHAHTPEEQLGFARQLLADGDQAFALLEHKRFLHHNRNHKDAPAAAITTAKLYIGYLNNVDRAEKELARTAAIHKNTAGGKQLLAFQQFIAANKSANAKALALYLGGETDSMAGRHSNAITKYNQILTDYPTSQLTDDALFALGNAHLDGMNKPDKAGPIYLKLINEHPKSPYFADANVNYVRTIEKQQGPTAEVQAAYQRIASRYPNTNAGRVAAERIKAIEKTTVVYKRTLNQKDVARYSVERAVYRTREQMEVSIELPSSATEKQVAATLEDALIQYVQKRSDKKHSVNVIAYFNYPLSKAGSLSWAPNQKAQFAVKKRDTEDKIKDGLLDLLKRQ